MRFYQLPPIVAVLPAIGVGWPLVTAQGGSQSNVFKGLGHIDVLVCMIFLLALAFSQVTADIGAVSP